MITFRLPSAARRHLPVYSLLLAVLLCLSAGAQAQTPNDDETVTVKSDLVRLNVGVADRKGRPVLDLAQGEFVVYENGVRQQVLSFEPSQTPFSLVLLLDMSGSTLNFRTTLKQAAVRFIDALGPDDRVAVVAFSAPFKGGRPADKIETLSGFTADRRKTVQAISLAEGKGGTNFYQALQYSLHELDKEGRRRKAVVVLTDGIDTQLDAQDRTLTANATTNAEAIAALNPEANQTLNAVLNAADQQGVTIYPLALPSGNPRIFEPLTPPQAAKYAAARARLQALANRTGGTLHDINRLEDLGRIYAQVAAEMRTLYSLSYQSSNRQTHNSDWRAITIEVTRPELVARTRTGYYAK